MSQIEQLRQIIVGENAEILDELKQRIESVEQRTKDVAEVLPAAIDERIKADNRLVDSFKQPVSLSLKQAIRTEPDAYAEILYPVMAPSIRRAISQAITSMMATINQMIESATSAQGIALRFESMRTGVPYAQLMLQRTLPFKVEHIYLIDRATEMLISESQALGVHSLDGDAVSAMFSAIQSFLQDSFSKNKSERLTGFKSDQYNVWVIHGSSMMLACVISGDAPESLRHSLYDALDKIHVEYANESAEFDGDTSKFRGVEGYLEPLMQLEVKSDIDNIAKKKKSSTLVPIFILLVAIACTAFYSFDRYSKLKTVEHFLRETPGVALTDAYWDSGNIVIEGLKDPDAQIPFERLLDEGIEKDDLQINTIPFRSLEFGMELQRFKKEFVFPEGVQLSAKDERISIYGESPIQWLMDNDIRLRQLSADHRVDISNLSASLSSVATLLKRDFSKRDLAGVTPLVSLINDRLLVEVSGEMPAQSLRLLNTMFARNYWVTVTAK